MRDGVMVDFGIRMEDKADGSRAWMSDDPETLREERREREERSRQEALTKARKGVDVKQALLEKVERQAKQPTVQEALHNEYSRSAPGLSHFWSVFLPLLPLLKGMEGQSFICMDNIC